MRHLKVFSMMIPQLPRRLIVTALLLVFTLQLVHVARVYSITWDESHHLYDGYTIWTKHDYRLNAEVPPLVKLVAALPLLPLHLYAPPNQGRAQGTEAFLDGKAFVFRNGGDRVLFPARMACMLFALLLAWLIYAATRNMFGDTAALAALVLFTFDPNVLANGTLVTTDTGSACCMFGAVFAFYRYVQAPSAARLVVAGLVTGLAMVAKFTGIFLCPILLLLAVVEALIARSLPLLAKRLAACAGILLCAWVVIWAFYGFRYAPAPRGEQLSPVLGAYLQTLPSKTNSHELALVARHRLLPEPYIWGLANTKKTEWEYTSYFFEHVYRHGPWQYFPAAFLIKSTLPLLILLLLAPYLLIRQEENHRRALCFLLVPVLVYFAAVTASTFDIGARHLLPIYPFLYVVAAATAAYALGRKAAWAAIAGVLLVWQICGTIRVSPAYMAFGNEAWGGPSQVHRYLSDANVDWGQQLKAVKLYLVRNHITECWFAYFPDGAVEPADYGIPCHRLPTANTLSWVKLPMDVPPVISGTVLISDSDLAGIEFGDGTLNPYQGFLTLKPVAIIQHGVYVYQGSFAVPLAAALVEVAKSADLRAAGNMQAALDLAAHAVDLAPGSAVTQLNYADMLTLQKRWSEARDHYLAANTLAGTVRPDLQQEALQPAIQAGLSTAGAHLTQP